MSVRRSPKSTSAQPHADPQALRAAAVALLARRDFASAELLGKLCAKGFDEDGAAQVIASLTREGLLNEERYAQHYVSYHAGRGQGPMRIAAELRRHGLPAALIDAALASGPDWGALARKVCRAKFGQALAHNWPDKARQARFLQYRGFSADHIRAATGADPDTGLADP